MLVEVKQEGSYYSVYVNGRRMVDRESFALADRIAGHLRHPRWDASEAAEVADSIRKWVKDAGEE